MGLFFGVNSGSKGIAMKTTPSQFTILTAPAANLPVDDEFRRAISSLPEGTSVAVLKTVEDVFRVLDEKCDAQFVVVKGATLREALALRLRREMFEGPRRSCRNRRPRWPARRRVVRSAGRTEIE